jgi:3-dehydroquinate dehydratase-2
MPAKSVLVIHGPNLNMLGVRQPEIYGTTTVDDHVATVGRVMEPAGWTVSSFVSNSEGEIAGAIQGARGQFDAIIINAGALTHYSWTLQDALGIFGGTKIEVHISNPGAREEFRHTSVIAPVVNGTIAGFGGVGYELAARAVLSIAG